MITIRTLAESIANHPGAKNTMNKNQIKEVLRVLGSVMRMLPEEQQKEVWKAIILGNKRLSEKIT